ncbi:hypothetical protein MMC25_000190 [Agyrium rufum]|nr:hypothetical protein [Agyrium rufum]
MVELLCAYSTTYIDDHSLPSPLHWLVMFNEAEIVVAAEMLLSGSSTEQNGLCRASIDFIPTAGHNSLHTTFIAEDCLELIGTPLHWAVRTRNLKLVELLIVYGADINARTDAPTPFTTGIHRPHLPALSPLDVAVMFHLPEMVARFLDLGADWEGGGTVFSASHSAFFCIGLTCTPFSRHVVHGICYRDALRNTIRLLIERGYNISDTNADGHDPLNIALSSADGDPYIIEELLAVGALPSQRTSQGVESALDIAISHAPYRRQSVERLRLILPYVSNVDDCIFAGLNALHAAAIGGSDAMVELLSTAPGFDVNVASPTNKNDQRGFQTALHLAVMFGSPEVIKILVHKGANIEALNAALDTPLQIAMRHHNVKAADTLIELGANVFFHEGEVASGTVLHYAVAGERSGHSIVKHMLTKHPRLQEQSVLDAVDSGG